MLNANDITANLQYSLPVTVFDELESTNLQARILATDSNNPSELIIIARRQTGGRGRLGRSFFSPDGGLYMSLLMRPGIRACEAGLITTTAAVAAARAIERISGRHALIKWVNDIYIDGKKICGILTESKSLPSGYIDYAVLGIGINLTPPKDGFPADIADKAGAVFEKLPQGADNQLAAEVINEFYRLFRNDFPEKCLNEYRSRSNVIGRRVDVMHIIDGTSVSAEAIGIDDDYRLIVRYDDGREEALGSGEVSIKPN